MCIWNASIKVFSAEWGMLWMHKILFYGIICLNNPGSSKREGKTAVGDFDMLPKLLWKVTP